MALQIPGCEFTIETALLLNYHYCGAPIFIQHEILIYPKLSFLYSKTSIASMASIASRGGYETEIETGRQTNLAVEEDG